MSGYAGRHRAYTPTDPRSEDAAVAEVKLGRALFYLGAGSFAGIYLRELAKQLGVESEVLERARTGRVESAS